VRHLFFPLRREFKQRLSAARHGALGSHPRDHQANRTHTKLKERRMRNKSRNIILMSTLWRGVIQLGSESDFYGLGLCLIKYRNENSKCFFFASHGEMFVVFRL
jgi:hypothetical protein